MTPGSACSAGLDIELATENIDMPKQVARILRELVRCTHDFGEGCGERKLRLLRTLEKRRLTRATDVLKLHEALCFLRAYPDNAELLTQVERMLDTFDRRGDLRRHRDELASTGIAGAPIHFQFFAESALRLARRWGSHLTIDWDEFTHSDKIEALLPLLALYCETLALDEYAFEVREWVERLKGSDETDAEFLLKRIGRMRMSSPAREVILDDLDIPLCLSPGPGTPSRTREKYEGLRGEGVLVPGGAGLRARQSGQMAATEGRPTDVPTSLKPAALQGAHVCDSISYQTAPVARSRPTLAEIAGRELAVRYLPPSEARKVIELCRNAMATRSRDLDAFAYASEHDVRIVDCEPGLQIALIGMTPDRRLMLETLYGYIVLRNGVPVGYGTITALFNSAEVAYTIFDTFRSGEAAHIFGWVLTITHRLFDAFAMMVDPYQIGKDNEDAIQSGAWWFYQKLGFAPRDPGARRIMRRELKRMKTRRGRRSSAATLRQLAEHNVFLALGSPNVGATAVSAVLSRRSQSTAHRAVAPSAVAHRDDILGVLPLANVGLQVSQYLAKHFGADREKATRECAKQARKLLGLRPQTRLSPGERLTWNRWSPLITTLPGLTRWSVKNKRALSDVIRAKGSRRESDYLQKFNAHRRLRTALGRLAGKDDES